MALNNVNKVSFHHLFSSTLHVKCCERKHTAMCHQTRPATTEGHAPLSPGHLPYWGSSHKHGTCGGCGHLQNVGPHLAAITNGHETSQINTKHNTIIAIILLYHLV